MYLGAFFVALSGEQDSVGVISRFGESCTEQARRGRIGLNQT